MNKPIALKEWAVTVRALAEGDQLVTMRKGGIREDGKHFRVEHSRFFLYPTFDHQRPDLVRPPHLPELRRALDEATWRNGIPARRLAERDRAIPQPEKVRIRAWAEIVRMYETTDPTPVKELAPYYIWTTDYAQKRLDWKPRHPLNVLLLRVHRIPKPVTLDVLPEYDGCKSWIRLDCDLSFEPSPVLADREFERAALEIDKIMRAHKIPARSARELNHA